jgi:hypothetical protein
MRRIAVAASPSPRPNARLPDIAAPCQSPLRFETMVLQARKKA